MGLPPAGTVVGGTASKTVGAVIRVLNSCTTPAELDVPCKSGLVVVLWGVVVSNTIGAP